MPEDGNRCRTCNQPAQYVCLYCNPMSFYCHDHRCIHFAENIAAEYEKSRPKVGGPWEDSRNAIVTILVILGFFLFFAFVMSTH